MSAVFSRIFKPHRGGLIVLGSGNVSKFATGTVLDLHSAKYKVLGVYNYPRIAATSQGEAQAAKPVLPVEPARCRTAVLAVLPSQAQGAADLCIRSGIKRIYNFSDAAIRVPPSVEVVEGLVTDDVKDVRHAETQTAAAADTEHLFDDDEVDEDNEDGEGMEEAESQLLRDFTVHEVLGRGGFGVVRRVQHHIDNQAYAVKAVMIHSEALENEDSKRVALEEVRVLARIGQHPNIVRYLNSWIEDATMSAVLAMFGNEDVDIDETTMQNALQQLHVIEQQDQAGAAESHLPAALDVLRNTGAVAPQAHYASMFKALKVGRSTAQDRLSEDLLSQYCGGRYFLGSGVRSAFSSIAVGPQALLEELDDSRVTWYNSSGQSLEDVTEDSKDADVNEEATTSSDRSDSIFVTPNQLGSPDIDPDELSLIMLQMEMCSPRTLRDVLGDTSRVVDREKALHVFRQIAAGVSHIHQHGVVHRDLKPANMFIDDTMHVKIGDFGLALDMSEGTATAVSNDGKAAAEARPSVSVRSAAPSETSAVGTALYVAPELEKAKPLTPYLAKKADVYAIGVVLLELFLPPFETQMERSRVISQALRSQKFPSSLVLAHRDIVQLIAQLTSPNPSERPSAKQLLKHRLLRKPAKKRHESTSASSSTFTSESD